MFTYVLLYWSIFSFTFFFLLTLQVRMNKLAHFVLVFSNFYLIPLFLLDMLIFRFSNQEWDWCRG